MEKYEKLYKEALERAREFVCKDNVEVAEYIFPELKESEDEKIRKELLNYLYDVHDDDESGASIASQLKVVEYLQKKGVV